MNEENQTNSIPDSFQTEFGSRPPEASGRPKRILVGGVIALVAVGVLVKGYSAYEYGQNHVETDNAYVSGDLVGISPTVAGTLSELTVKDGDFVKRGQLIARLDSSGLQAELAQARANLSAALTQVPQAQSSLTFEKLSTQAAIQRSNAEIAAQLAKTQSSRFQARLSSDTVSSEVARAQSQLEQTIAEAAQAKAGIATARAELASANQAVITAQNNADAQKAMIAAASADVQKSSQDFERYKKLLASEAITRQEYDSAVASLSSSNANLESVKEKSMGTSSQVAQAKAAVEQSQAMLTAAQRQFEAAEKQVEVARAGLQLARTGRTNVQIQDSNIQTNLGQQNQAEADLATAQAGAQQINLREKQVATSRAQVEQARAAVRQAEIRVKDANLYAPCDGFVVKHTVNVGTAINPGQNIVTITRGNDLWVMANYKETQLTHVREGQSADIEVDAFPGVQFHGKVLNIIRATGSATTLLPPDNSTGNFTKVVQRVPVKVSLDSPKSGGQSRIPVSIGMSVVVTVDTSKASD